MKTNLEIEYKVLISKDCYYKIQNDLFQNVPKLLQTNYYYDTNKFDLIKNKIMARIREFDNRTNEFTLKIPNQSIEVQEYSIENVQSILDPKICELFTNKQLPIPSFSPFFSKTLRQEINYLSGKLALDENKFLNSTDFELEFEITDPTQNHLKQWQALCQRFDIQYVQATSKVKRAYLDYLSTDTFFDSKKNAIM